MYKNDVSVGVKSDLVNSYAWDTAIVFIQEMGNTNYANKNSMNGSILNTGTIVDKACNVFDMASNCWEWTTEYCTNQGYPCMLRGGNFTNSGGSFTAYRLHNSSNNLAANFTFRVLLYIK